LSCTRTIAGEKSGDRVKLYGEYGNNALSDEDRQAFLDGRVTMKEMLERPTSIRPLPTWMAYSGGEKVSALAE